MANYTLMTSQKNEVLELIKRTTLDPFNFSWSPVLSKLSTENERPLTVSKLSYDNSPYYFIFDFLHKRHYCFFSPGNDKQHDNEYPGGWRDQLRCLMQWLEYLQREVRQPDLWDELARQKISYDAYISKDTTNEPFSVSHSQQIAEGIEKIRSYLASEFKDNSNAQKLINEKLDYLLDAAKRQGRKDWFHTCIGVFVSLATALAMSPEQTKNIWVILKSAVSGILKLTAF